MPSSKTKVESRLVDPLIKSMFEECASIEDRSLSYMVAKLIKDYVWGEYKKGKIKLPRNYKELLRLSKDKLPDDIDISIEDAEK